MVPLSGGVDLSEDGKVFGEIVKVESLRCDRIELSVLVVFRRKEGSDDPFSDRIEVDLEEKGFPMGQRHKTDGLFIVTGSFDDSFFLLVRFSSSQIRTRNGWV